MNALVLLALSAGAEPDAELEKARAAVAVALAKANLSAPASGVVSGPTTWKVTGYAETPPPGTVYAYFPPLGRYAHVHESLATKEVRQPQVASTFRGAGYNASHNCPVCGRSQYVISGRGPVPGSHTHTCAAGHTWWH